MTVQLFDTCESRQCDAIATIRLWSRGQLGMAFHPRGIFCISCADRHVGICDYMAHAGKTNKSILTPIFACSYEWLPAAELDGDLISMMGIWQKMENIIGIDATSTCQNVSKFVDQILKDAKSNPDLQDEPVNWTDLRCEDVSIGVNSEGRRMLSIWVGEASPNATKLAGHIQKAIMERFDGHDITVNVELEW